MYAHILLSKPINNTGNYYYLSQLYIICRKGQNEKRYQNEHRHPLQKEKGHRHRFQNEKEHRRQRLTQNRFDLMGLTQINPRFTFSFYVTVL